MDIEQEFEKFVEEDEAYGGTKKWKKGQNKMKKAGITLQKKDKFSGYVEEDEKEARTYLNKKDDDEDKKKRHFAFGGKKKEKHGKSGYRKGEEVEKRWTGGKLPPHLAKFFDKDGNLKKDAAARVAKGREKINWKDVTPKGYGPKEEVEKQTKLKEKIMDLEDTVKQVIGETNKNDKSDDGDGLDAVQPKAVKKKFKDRKDKDIDNDGDTDDSDKFLHKKRKAISKAISKEEVSEAYWKVSIPDMTPIFVETGSKSDIMKDMRKKLKPEALKGLAIERVSKAEMIKTYRNLVKGEGGEEEEPKKEERLPSKLFGHIKTLMQKN